MRLPEQHPQHPEAHPEAQQGEQRRGESATSSPGDPCAEACGPAHDEGDGIRYQIQPIVVTALGSPRGIFSFLESLGEPAPSAVVSSIQLSGLDSASVAKLSIQFYLSPQSVLDTELEDGARK